MENKLYFLLNQAQQKLYKEVDRESLAELGVTSAQAAALYHLQKRNGCLQAELGKALGLGKAATSGMVVRLEKQGLIKRTPSPVDGRGQRVLITVDGLQVSVKARPLLNRMNKALEEGFNEKELDVVRRYLNSIVERLSSS
ncbi:MarR family winged helix-turn-helix transcriptional regulator [Parendozoicomonas sp. Alg238-R29]|uniref:MarR family winged helix-turn-helix transcriptional regulator n=1 Tax=Parendozoicomonas sp. Alg238-R29 TaxID=2993446 RepID=UPI00248E0ED5|nr:MarR family winged helix-turn-helix transcriptional regulator [Parendozoicomonas sp. Alg238-R29]